MVSKESFLSKCRMALTYHLPESSADATFYSLSKALGNSDSDELPQELIEDCLNRLYKRIIIFKGTQDANVFLDDLMKEF